MSQSFTAGTYIQLKSAQSVKWDAIKIGIIDYLMHGCAAQYTVVYLYYNVLKSSVILNFLSSIFYISKLFYSFSEFPLIYFFEVVHCTNITFRLYLSRLSNYPSPSHFLQLVSFKIYFMITILG